ncbi:metallophosphoesterase family protein [Mucilaginibacter terrae]|uniref:Icc-related predicted phosphoesterase n=1 Tax=Mucilaginibacter terrae TaxID=1955052 RepID=A0ABU3H2V5_9SPHI|nr:metallophosphoesterase [Mucilaginibacter terrae]MDT3405245.1 Icc-related predicted phosphoesterase [Mucilaginibacter terrae]
MDEKKVTRIAAVGDIHVKENDKGKWVNYFKEVSAKADVLLICGDLTDTGDEDEAIILAEELRACSIPVVCVLGNHDYEKGRHKLIRQTIQNANVHVLDGESIVIGGVGFAGVKGFGGGFDRYLLTMFGEDANKAYVQEAVDEALHLERALNKLEGEFQVDKKIAVLHYSPIKATVVGEPEEIYPFLGSSRLAEPLIRNNVIAAFHGHAHAGTLEGRIVNSDIKVFNVAKQVLSKAGYEHTYYLLEV